MPKLKTSLHKTGIFLTCLALLTLGGCAAQPVSLDHPNALATPWSDYPHRATVYFLRNDSFAYGGWWINIAVDGKGISSLRRGEYAEFPVSPGMHVLKAAMPAIAATHPLTLKVKFLPEHTYYFLYRTWAQGMGYDVKQLSNLDAFPLLKKYEKQPLIKSDGSSKNAATR